MPSIETIIKNKNGRLCLVIYFNKDKNQFEVIIPESIERGLRRSPEAADMLHQLIDDALSQPLDDAQFIDTIES